MAQGVPGPPLSSKGRIAAAQAALAWQDCPLPDMVLVSPATRATETAALLFPGLAVTTCAGLREVDPGDWGTPGCDEGIRMHADLMRRWERGVDLDLAPPGGESGTSVLDRLGHVVRNFENPDRGLVVAITHFGVIRMLLAAFVLEHDPDAMPAPDFPPPLQSLAFRCGLPQSAPNATTSRRPH